MYGSSSFCQCRANRQFDGNADDFPEPLNGLEYGTESCGGGAMRADRVEVSWDSGKSKWLVRIVSGEEVIRRHCSAPKGADEQTLRSAAQNTVRDEGYDLDAQTVSIVR
jgi:hypothetical protein